jgi:apolipoprotein D and lipocalin family protein
LSGLRRHSVHDRLKYEPVSDFQLERYLGKWYEIARLPAQFERGLVNVTATYTIRPDGKVQVLNEGYKETKNGKHSTAIGKAKFAESQEIGHLKVSFFGPFYANYVIIDLDKEHYSYAMVASSLRYLWILCRQPQMEQGLRDKLVKKARGLGFDTDQLYFTPQDW